MTRRAPEKIVQRDVKRLLEFCGWTVYDFTQPRATMQTPGIPDLFCRHLGQRAVVWFECKAPKGRMTPAQKRFQNEAARCGETYIVGGYDEAVELCERYGLCERKGHSVQVAVNPGACPGCEAPPDLCACGDMEEA